LHTLHLKIKYLTKQPTAPDTSVLNETGRVNVPTFLHSLLSHC